MSEFAVEKARKRTRRYRVEETLTVVGTAEIEAVSKAEVRAMIERGEVEFYYNDGQDIRRGDGIKVYLVTRPTKPGDPA